MKRRRDIFEVIEEMMRKNIEEMHRRMEEMDMDIEDIEKEMRKPGHHKAFSIKITQNNDNPPEIIVEEFGDEHTKKKIEPEENEEWVMEEPPKKVKEFKEADTKIKEDGDKLTIEIDLPKKISKEDIEMHKLSNSLEIRAYHGKTGYYAIFPMEKAYQIVKDELKNGKYKLHIKTN